MNILVVDDEAAYRLLLKNFLMEEHWTVVVAEDGEEALDKLNQVKLDIIISDVYMPIMDGVKFHRTLREIPGMENVPFIFVSAYDDVNTLAVVANPKIEVFLRKGKSIGVLKEWIRYLTTPESKRSLTPPSREGGAPPPKRRGTESRGGTPTMIS